MTEIPDGTIDLIITSPPYFNIKDYSKDGYQSEQHSELNKADLSFPFPKHRTKAMRLP